LVIRLHRGRLVGLPGQAYSWFFIKKSHAVPHDEQVASQSVSQSVGYELECIQYSSAVWWGEKTGLQSPQMVLGYWQRDCTEVDQQQSRMYSKAASKLNTKFSVAIMKKSHLSIGKQWTRRGFAWSNHQHTRHWTWYAGEVAQQRTNMTTISLRASVQDEDCICLVPIINGY